MNILITGGLGNLGLAVTDYALERVQSLRRYRSDHNHTISVLVHSNSSRNKKRMKPYKDKVNFIIGSITDKSFVHSVMKNVDCVIHLAALLPPRSEESYERTYKVNVTGTRNIIDAIEFYDNKACLLFASSTSIYGPTQHKNRPLCVDDEPNPIDNYTKSKVEAEKLLHESGIRYSILRFASVLTDIGGYELSMIKLIYDFPLKGRNEVIFPRDAAAATLNCAELFLTDEEKVLRKTFIIGGGKKNGCQITNGIMLSGMFEGLGLVPPCEDCFKQSMDTYYMDWYDTEESQRILNFQNTTFEDYKKALKEQRVLQRLPRFMTAFLKTGLERFSPYKNKNKKEDGSI